MVIHRPVPNGFSGFARFVCNAEPSLQSASYDPRGGGSVSMVWSFKRCLLKLNFDKFVTPLPPEPSLYCRRARVHQDGMDVMDGACIDADRSDQWFIVE